MDQQCSDEVHQGQGQDVFLAASVKQTTMHVLANVVRITSHTLIKVVTDTNSCITECRDDTCYRQCISNKWPGPSGYLPVSAVTASIEHSLPGVITAGTTAPSTASPTAITLASGAVKSATSDGAFSSPFLALVCFCLAVGVTAC
ncbi:hypothetical protein BDF14DRAFT_1881846 [Spinellus fusiger]|nr:hypothetical protein BDF14DRAFT_1881846 [Spinellus fusiger]